MTDFFSVSQDEQLARLTRAAGDVLRHWNMEDADLDLIKYRENAVFEVSNGDIRAALRLHRHGYHSDDALSSELKWMEALSDSGIRVPNVIPTAAGDAFAHVDDDGLAGVMQVDLFEWIDGKQLGSIEEGVADADEAERIFGSLGELAAKVHNQSVSWNLPDGFTRHAWDADGLAGENPVWGRFWEIEAATDEQRSLLSRARERIYDELSALPKSPGKYSMIHADFVAENILVDGDDLRLIDFDDAGFGWHLFELVTALIFLRGETYFDAAEAALFDGYAKHRSLTDEDLALLPLFYLARSTTYVGWVHTKSETDTARELTPMLISMACELAEEYLSN
jgi:Ser/Thr protein kinase RdoA (MazF antagonist)